MTPLARSLTCALVVVAAAAIGSSLVTVDATEYAALVRFGRIARVIGEPGLHLKAPYPFEQVIRLDRRLLTFKPTSAEYLSGDKKNLVIQGLVSWRIASPERFLSAVGDRESAERRLNDIVLARLGAVLGHYPSTAFMSIGPPRTEFDALVGRVTDQARDLAGRLYGIEVVDIRIRQIGLPDQNRANVFARMQAERGKIATQYRSEGEREFKKIVAGADRERTQIMAEARREAERITAEGDAQAMRIYAEAFGKNPQFYKFSRTLTAYDKILDANTMVFLPADADVFRVLDGARPPVGGR